MPSFSIQTASFNSNWKSWTKWKLTHCSKPRAPAVGSTDRAVPTALAPVRVVLIGPGGRYHSRPRVVPPQPPRTISTALQLIPTGGRSVKAATGTSLRGIHQVSGPPQLPHDYYTLKNFKIISLTHMICILNFVFTIMFYTTR
jgi:hypothetical protein